MKWQELPYTGPIFIYTTRDRSSGTNSTAATLGIYHTDWTPKTAQQTVRGGASGAIPKSVEYQRFAGVTDSALGTPLSPVFKTADGNWAQVRTVSTVFETKSGFITSPRPRIANSPRPACTVVGEPPNHVRSHEVGDDLVVVHVEC